LTPAKETYAVAWPKTLAAKPLVGTVTPKELKSEPIAWLKEFAVPADLAADGVRVVVERSVANGRTARLPHWAAYPEYQEEEAAIRGATEAIGALRGGGAEELGMALFKARQAGQKAPTFPPLQFVLAELQARKEQPEQAEKGFQSAVRADAGRTDVS